MSRKPDTPVGRSAALASFFSTGAPRGCSLKPHKARSQRRDYRQLAERARALVEADGLSENAASVAISQEVEPDLDKQETVARGIRRQFLKAHPAKSITKIAAPAGYGALHAVLASRLELLRKEVEGFLETRTQFKRAAEVAGIIRSIVEKRLEEVKALGRTEGLAQVRHVLAGLDDVDPSTSPFALVQREMRELEALLDTARELHMYIKQTHLPAVRIRPRPL